MSEAERAFYEWWHTSSLTGEYMPKLREVFLAGWNAANAAAFAKVVSDD